LLIVPVVGCAPQISTITPTTADRLQPVRVKGQRLLTATINVDGGNLGSWIIAGENPSTTKGIVIPARKADGVTSTAGAVTVRACNAWGCDAATINVTAGPASGSTPMINVVPPFNSFECNFWGTPAECVTVVGADLYPGESTTLRPHAGPSARAIPQGAGSMTTALGTEMIAENAVLVFFPDTMSAGTYKVEIANTPRFGGPSGTTANTFTR
jgi:hypothetical protein